MKTVTQAFVEINSTKRWWVGANPTQFYIKDNSGLVGQLSQKMKIFYIGEKKMKKEYIKEIPGRNYWKQLNIKVSYNWTKVKKRCLSQPLPVERKEMNSTIQQSYFAMKIWYTFYKDHKRMKKKKSEIISNGPNIEIKFCGNMKKKHYLNTVKPP